MYITESLCCIPGTNTILKINYTPIKLKYKKGKNKVPLFLFLIRLLVNEVKFIDFYILCVFLVKKRKDSGHIPTNPHNNLFKILSYGMYFLYSLWKYI